MRQDESWNAGRRHKTRGLRAMLPIFLTWGFPLEGATLGLCEEGLEERRVRASMVRRAEERESRQWKQGWVASVM